MLCDHSDIVNQYRKFAEEFICHKYSWDDVVDKTLDLYRSTIDI